MPKTTKHTSKKEVADEQTMNDQQTQELQNEESQTSVLDTIDVDNMSPEDISAMFDELDTERKTKTESAIPADVIREKFIKPLFAAGRKNIPVSTLQHTIDRIYKLTGDNKMQYSSVRSAAGAHRVGLVNNVSCIFPYPVDKNGNKLTDAEIAAIEARSKIAKKVVGTTADQIDNLANDLANG